MPLQIDEHTLDYTAMPTNKIFLVQQKGLIDRERPSWIPEFSQNNMAYNRLMPFFEKQGDNYLIYADRDKPLRYLITPEIFAATLRGVSIDPAERIYRFLGDVILSAKA
ncbi:MAG: hypothetical protein Ta2F_02900 [Termitinemataceae bacterium]|nr:MAG: hypothetical protein Ta2F_02900 [Termitinemataceae bacterium]